MHNKCWWRGHCFGKGIWSPITTVKRGHVILKASLQASIKKRKHQIFSLKVDGLCHDEASWHQISQLKAKSEQKQEKIIALKDHTNHLLKDILRECIASNVIIGKAIIEACVFTTKTLEIIREATVSMLRPKNKSLLSALMKMLGYMQWVLEGSVHPSPLVPIIWLECYSNMSIQRLFGWPRSIQLQ